MDKYYVGIDIGSTASKVVVRGSKDIQFVIPTGWSGKETAYKIKEILKEKGIDVESDNVTTVATGYGRVSCDYATFVLTEITCHGRGGRELLGDNLAIIDVGGQDTKVIIVEDGMIQDFLMNDKCSAGTGKFLEIMSNRLAMTINELFDYASLGTPIEISSLCTVFAESEIISLIGEGRKREDIASGVVYSVVKKVAQLARRKALPQNILLTGGLSHCPYFATLLSKELNREVHVFKEGYLAGALGGALLASEKKRRK